MSVVEDFAMVTRADEIVMNVTGRVVNRSERWISDS